VDIYAYITNWEGVRLKPYCDECGQPIVWRGAAGWTCKCKPSANISPSITIGRGRDLSVVGLYSGEDVMMQRNDVAERLAELPKRYDWFNQMQADGEMMRAYAIVDLSFNCGVGAVGEFHDMIAAIQRKDWRAAAKAMLDSAFARERLDRASADASLLENGEWPSL